MTGLLEILFLALFAQMERLDQWLDRRAKARRKAAYLQRTGGTEQCPHCEKWTWETDGWAKVECDIEHAALDRMTCKNCGGQSRWHYGPGLFLFVDAIAPKKEQP